MWSRNNVTLANGVGRRRPLFDGDLDRVFEVLFRDLANRSGDGSRKKCHLPFLGSLCENPFDILGETHSQHLVGFVQHQTLKTVEFQRAASHVVHHTTGSSDDNLSASFQMPKLDLIILSAKNRDHLQSAHSAGIFLERTGDLDRQFTRWHKYEDLWLFLAEINSLEQRQRESCGLAGAGLRLAEDVATLKQWRNGLSLNRRR